MSTASSWEPGKKKQQNETASSPPWALCFCCFLSQPYSQKKEEEKAWLALPVAAVFFLFFLNHGPGHQLEAVDSSAMADWLATSALKGNISEVTTSQLLL